MAGLVQDHIVMDMLKPDGKTTRAQQKSLEELLDVPRAYIR